MKAVLVSFQWVSKHLLNEDKASGGCLLLIEREFELLMAAPILPFAMSDEAAVTV